MSLSSGVFNISSNLTILSNLISSQGSYSLIAHPYKLLASICNIILFSSHFLYLLPITELIPPPIIFSKVKIKLYLEVFVI